MTSTAGAGDGRIETASTSAERCFLCGRDFRPTYGEPILIDGEIALCVGCGILYELPECC